MSALKVLQLQRHTDVLGEERKRLLDSAREQTFTSATVLGEAPERQSWRRASVCFNWPLMAEARLRNLRLTNAASAINKSLSSCGTSSARKPCA